MSNLIPLSVPSIKGNEWQYLKECLDTEWVSSAGKYVDIFENKIAEYTGSKHAVACVNGTSALQVSLQVAGVNPGDEVIVPTLTFIAPVNAIAYNGASPVFIGADDQYNIDVEKTLQFIRDETVFENGFTYNKITGKKISAIIPVHIWGNAVFLDELISLFEERNIVIVEDASESLGTFYNAGKHTGTIGKLGCLSFNGNKIITTGGGGMILTNNAELAEKAKYLTTQAKNDHVYYIHDKIGFNYRLTNVQAALGVAQLEQITEFLERKKVIYEKYITLVENIDGLDMLHGPDYAENNHWMNVLRINPSIYFRDRDRLMNDLLINGIQTRPVWHLNHLQKPYKNCQAYKTDKVEKLVETSLCLPSSVSLSYSEIVRVVDEIKNKK